MAIRHQISSGLWAFLVMMMLIDGIAALVNVSSSAYWDTNGIIIVGQPNGTVASSNNYLNKSESISITSDDTLYIADGGGNRIVSVQLDNISIINAFGSGPGSGDDQFNYPSGVSVTDTAVYVMDRNNDRVQKWLRNGTNPMTILNSSYIDSAYFIYVDKYDNLYVTEYDNSKVNRFAPNSLNPVIVAGTGSRGSGANQLSFPIGCFVDDVGTVYVADFVNHRVQKWISGASSGITVAGTGYSGSGLGELSYPKCVVVDTNGFIYIVDSGNDRIVRWAPNASTGVCIIACTGTSGNQPYQLGSPAGMVFDSNGSIYISENDNHRVMKFQILNNANYNVTTLRTTQKLTTSQTIQQSRPINSLINTLQVSFTAKINSTVSSAHFSSTARWSKINLSLFCGVVFGSLAFSF